MWFILFRDFCLLCEKSKVIDQGGVSKTSQIGDSYRRTRFLSFTDLDSRDIFVLVVSTKMNKISITKFHDVPPIPILAVSKTFKP